MSEKETHESTSTQEEKIENEDVKDTTSQENTETEKEESTETDTLEENSASEAVEEESEEIDEVEALQVLLAEKESKIAHMEGILSISQKNIGKLEKQISELHKKLHDVNNAYIKEKEDLVAYKDRFQRQMESRETRRRGEVVKILFEPLENLRRSHESIKKNAPEMATGIEMVIKAFMKGFTDLGLEEIDPAGQKFNPNEHSALMMQPTPDPALDEVVLQTFSLGYRIEGLILQPAQVIVGRYDGPPIEVENNEADNSTTETEDEQASEKPDLKIVSDIEEPDDSATNE